MDAILQKMFGNMPAADLNRLLDVIEPAWMREMRALAPLTILAPFAGQKPPVFVVGPPPHLLSKV